MSAFEKIPGFKGPATALRFEADVYDCEVIGNVPTELNGRLFRLGPDRQYPTLEDDNYINGDGMISSFTFADGHVDYRCRYVKTARHLAERAARKRLYGKYRNPFTDLPEAPTTDRDNTGNTTAFFHAGRLFALREDSHPHEIDPLTLETLPTIDFGGALQSVSMTAHPKIDPDTGEWWSFALFSKGLHEGEMMLQVIDKHGNLIRQEEFQAPYPGFTHDFAVTKDYVIFDTMPLTVDKARVRAGGAFYAYDPAHVPMWGVMPRTGTTKDIRWFAAPGTFTAHIMNAYSDGAKIYVDALASREQSFPFWRDIHDQPTNPDGAMPCATRLTFDLERNDGFVDVAPFEGAFGELPRVDDRYQMKPYRYGFMMGLGGVLKLDWHTGKSTLHAIPDSPMGVQEPVFVPRSPDSPEGDGFILVVVNRAGKNLADLLILDAMNFADPPLAIVKLPFDQPFAFHGCFVSEGGLLESLHKKC